MAEKLYARDVYGQTLVELGKQDSHIVVMDADLSGSTRTKLFAAEFPQRFFQRRRGRAEYDGDRGRPGFRRQDRIRFHILDVRYRSRARSGS